MSTPKHNNMEENRLEYGNTDQFTCPRCFKILSATRPPVFNSDNCSCVEAAEYNGAMQRTYPSPYEHTSHTNWIVDQYQAPANMYPYNPESYASSSRSVPSPEGVENSHPNINISNDFLPLVTDRGLNEDQHQRRSSFRTDLSYQMRRFLVEREYDQPATPTGFLSQETYMLSEKSQSYGNRKSSKESKKSLQSSRSGDMNYVGYGADPITAFGAWVEDSQESQYAMTLSGISGLVMDD